VAQYDLWMSTHGLRLIPNDVLWMSFGHQWELQVYSRPRTTSTYGDIARSSQINYRFMPRREVIYGYHISSLTQRLKNFHVRFPFFCFSHTTRQKIGNSEKKLYIINKTSFNIRCMYFVILRQIVHIKIALYILAPCPT
jgi:hypothetical protein